MHLKKIVTSLILSFVTFLPQHLIANNELDELDEITQHYNVAESATIDKFSLVTKFNIVSMPEQPMSELLSKRIADFLKRKGLTTAVRSNIETSRNIIINYVDIIEGYGRGDNVYRLKITKNNILIEYTSSTALYWAYDALIKQFVENHSFATKIFKKNKFYFEKSYIVSNEGDESGSDVIRLTAGTLNEKRITEHINKALLSNISTVYIELLTSKGCKLRCKSIEVFNPTSNYLSSDAITIDELERLNQYAQSMGISLVPVLDLSNPENEILTQFTGHNIFSVEGLRFSRALLKEVCEGTSVMVVCLGRKVNDEMTQLKYIDPLVEMLHKNGKRAVAW